MVPPHATVELQRLLVVIVEVGTEHLRRAQSAASSSEVASSATAGKPSVAHVVGVSEGHDPNVVLHHGSHEAFRVAVVCAHAHVDVRKHALVHAFLYAEIENCRLVAVVNACHASQIALLVISLDFVHDGCGQVLEGCLRVARHKLLSVHLDLLYLFAVDRYLSAFVDLGTRQALHQFLNGRSLGCAESRRVVDERVFLHHHLHGLSRHGCSLEHYGVFAHGHVAHVHVAVVANGDVLHQRFVAHACELEQKLSVLRRLEAERASHVAHRSRHIGAVCSQQLHGDLFHRFLCVVVGQRAADFPFLCACCQGHDGEQQRH